MGAKEGFALCCMVMSVWAVPLLFFFGILCAQGSPMINVPADQKKDAAWGCFGSAILYGLTFVGAFRYRQKADQQASARNVIMQEMQEVTDRTRM
mmetsp:Transcript_87725/g.248539  ORF Transcript_87725/g.248539 Transcript_87725/m.248539 type:complete len:95 (+) Transcript_87725:102-386(+)